MVPKRPLACVPVLLAILLVAKAHAIIDPNFTPIHLVGQSALILELDLKQGKTKDQYLGTVREVLKGKTDLKVLTFDLSKAANEQHVDGFRRLVKASAGQPALFFVGTFLADDPGDGETGGAPPKKVGYLHVSAKWCDFQGATGTAWDLTVLATAREKLWAGGTDMLRRAVDYILGEDNPQVPVKAGASWRGKPSRVGTFAGGIRAVKPIDLAGNGEFALFVAADKGDRLLVCDRKTRKFKDVTARKKLSSASQFFGWGEFNGDGTLDLISLSGGRLSLYAQQADGAFRPAALDLPAALAKDCVGLVALDCGNKRLSGVLVSGASAPRLVVFRANAKPAVIPLTTRGVDVAKYGRAGACIVADFDGDHLPDIIQPFTKGSLFFKGRAPGKFAPAAACAMYLGPGRSNWCLADFDADGRLDIFTVAEDACRIWQNQGGGKFAELLNASGEIAYISQGRGIDCMVGDVNNDGRQDVLICYDTEGPQIFFNRGFRSFGHSHMLDVSEKKLLKAAESGQRAGCLGDFDGDGAQDMALALPNGEVYVFFRDNGGGDSYNVSAVLPVKGACKGPVTVVGWVKSSRRGGKPRCLGAWNVAPGTRAAFLGREQPGPVTIEWTPPGGKKQKKRITVEDEPVRLQIK